MEPGDINPNTMRQAEITAIKRPNVSINYESNSEKGGVLSDDKQVGNCLFHEVRRYDPKTGNFVSGSFNRNVMVNGELKEVDTIAIESTPDGKYTIQRLVIDATLLKTWTTEFNKACAEKKGAEATTN